MRWYLFLLLACFVDAAVIYGTVYHWASLEPMQDSFIEVNSSPKIFIVSRNGSYSFQVEPGYYRVTANHYNRSELDYSCHEEILVKQAGAYRLDLVMVPPIEFEEPLLDLPEAEADLFELGEEEPDYAPTIIAAALLVAAALAGYVLFKKRETRKKQREPGLDGEARRALEIIGEEGRITQKELRKQMPHSEAKVSLIISELEARGLIKKYKKGRGNILVKTSESVK